MGAWEPHILPEGVSLPPAVLFPVGPPVASFELSQEGANNGTEGNTDVLLDGCGLVPGREESNYISAFLRTLRLSAGFRSEEC